MNSKKESSLRYLLLKHIWFLRSNITPELHREVARSLKIIIADNTTTIRWSYEGKQNSKTIPNDDFVFYERGDRKDVSPSKTRQAINAERASVIATEMLSLNGAKEPLPAINIGLNPIYWSILVSIAGIVSFSQSSAPLIFTLLVFAERLFWGSPIPLMFFGISMLIFQGAVYSTLFVNVWLIFLTYMDTDRRFRYTRIGFYSVTALSCAFLMELSPIIKSDLIVLLVIIAANLVVLVWLNLTHEAGNMSLMVAPILSIGIALSGSEFAACVLTIMSIFAALLTSKSRNIFKEM